jgi:hypothetical protein
MLTVVALTPGQRMEPQKSDELTAVIGYLTDQLARLDVDGPTRRRLAAGLRAGFALDAEARGPARALLLAALSIAERVRLNDQRPRRFSDAELVATVERCKSLAEAAKRLGVAPSSITRRVQKLRFNATASALQGTVNLPDSGTTTP